MFAHHALGPNGRLGMKEIPVVLIWACGVRELAMWVDTRILLAQMPQQMPLRCPRVKQLVSG